jgi:V/A-type H+-transporting ATPase subunit D
MAELTPTRSLALALADERRTMREGYAFLDEKCLLLAGEMLRELRHHQALTRTYLAHAGTARAAIAAGVMRHGLAGLQVAPAAPAPPAPVRHERTLLGVAMLDATLPMATDPAAPAVNPSPELAACRTAHLRLLGPLTELAAVSTNLARLVGEYRRTVRRVRALQDVLLPEIDASISDIETQLEDAEREDALAMRRRRA